MIGLTQGSQTLWLQQRHRIYTQCNILNNATHNVARTSSSVHEAMQVNDVVTGDNVVLNMSNYGVYPKLQSLHNPFHRVVAMISSHLLVC